MPNVWENLKSSRICFRDCLLGSWDHLWRFHKIYLLGWLDVYGLLDHHIHQCIDQPIFWNQSWFVWFQRMDLLDRIVRYPRNWNHHHHLIAVFGLVVDCRFRVRLEQRQHLHHHCSKVFVRWRFHQLDCLRHLMGHHVQDHHCRNHIVWYLYYYILVYCTHIIIYWY